MAFPTIESSTDSTTNSNTTTHTVSYPATVDAGDLLVCFFCSDGVETVSYPGAWVHLFEKVTSGGTNITISVGWLEAAGTEDGGTFDITTGSSERSVQKLYRITGAEDPDTQAPEYAVTAATPTSANPDPPSVTPTGGAKDYLWLPMCGWDNNTFTTATGAPSGYSLEQNTLNNSQGSGVGIGEQEINAASEDPGTFTLDNARRQASATVVIHPVAAAGANPKGPLGMPLHGPFGGPI